MADEPTIEEVAAAKAKAKALAEWFDTADTEKGTRTAEALRTLLADHSSLEDRAEAAESRLASLTGQVEDMRERAAKVADEWGWSSKPDHAHGIRDAIRSLPVLPTPGDGGETP